MSIGGDNGGSDRGFDGSGNGRSHIGDGGDGIDGGVSDVNSDDGGDDAGLWR